MSRYEGDVCPDCRRARPFRTTISPEGKLVAYFTVCLCDKTCQLPEAVSLYNVLSGKEKLED